MSENHHKWPYIRFMDGVAWLCRVDINPIVRPNITVFIFIILIHNKRIMSNIKISYHICKNNMFTSVWYYESKYFYFENI